MTITARSCAEFLRKYNDWRRGGEGQQPEPKEIGMNLDFAIAALESDADIATLEQESLQMLARMERLEKELETERALSFRAQVAELEQRISGLEKDAARYQWLKGQFSGVDFEWGKFDEESEGRQVIVFDWPWLPVGADCDKNIDAAIASAKGGAE